MDSGNPDIQRMIDEFLHDLHDNEESKTERRERERQVELQRRRASHDAFIQKLINYEPPSFMDRWLPRMMMLSFLNRLR